MVIIERGFHFINGDHLEMILLLAIVFFEEHFANLYLLNYYEFKNLKD
jgi:hypothetical protein